MSRLEELVATARESVERRRSRVPQEELEDRLRARGEDRPFMEALSRPGVSLVAEFKRRSPGAGDITPRADVAEVVSAYERGGAAALSILTDETNFGGSLNDLRAAREASELPILRKDFIVDPYQLVEAAVYGADAVLLIVPALHDVDLAELHDHARGLDLDTLVEVHDESDLGRALEVGADVIGINNRNLADLRVDTEATLRLMPDVPAGKTVVAESGYEHPDQIRELDRIGVDAVLIGETLMRAADPESAARELSLGEQATGEHSLDF
jgi:indole-3-glycerol phosphate synthase